MQNREPYTVMVLMETHRAWLVVHEDQLPEAFETMTATEIEDHLTSDQRVWLPKSKVDVDGTVERGGLHEFQVPDWIAIESGWA
jgi:hypothetical protein